MFKNYRGSGKAGAEEIALIFTLRRRDSACKEPLSYLYSMSADFAVSIRLSLT
jgi:hypothetical protein